MKLTIKSKQKSALPRTEYTVSVEYDKNTPSRHNLIEALAKETKTDAQLIIIKEIQNNYGERNTVVSMYAYDSSDVLEAIEHKTMKEKNKLPVKEEPKAEENAGEEAQSE